MTQGVWIYFKQNGFDFPSFRQGCLSRHAAGIQKHHKLARTRKPFRHAPLHTHTQIYRCTHPPPYCISQLHCDGLCHRFNFSYHLLAGGPASQIISSLTDTNCICLCMLLPRTHTIWQGGITLLATQSASSHPRFQGLGHCKENRQLFMFGQGYSNYITVTIYHLNTQGSKNLFSTLETGDKMNKSLTLPGILPHLNNQAFVLCTRMQKSGLLRRLVWCQWQPSIAYCFWQAVSVKTSMSGMSVPSVFIMSMAPGDREREQERSESKNNI